MVKKITLYQIMPKEQYALLFTQSYTGPHIRPDEQYYSFGRGLQREKLKMHWPSITSSVQNANKFCFTR